MPTIEQTKHLISLKAICALSNTCQRIFGKLPSNEPIFLEIIKPLLEDLVNRMKEVENEKQIDELYSKITAFINTLDENTTNADIARIFLMCHQIIDPIYWRFSTEIGIPHP